MLLHSSLSEHGFTLVIVVIFDIFRRVGKEKRATVVSSSYKSELRRQGN